MNTLGETAQRLRDAQGITRDELARRSQLNSNWLGRLEQGELSQTELALPRLRQIAAALGYSLVGFLREAGMVEPGDIELSADPGLRQLVANYSALNAEEREAVDTLIQSLAKRGKK